MSVASKVKSGILLLAIFPILAMIAAWQQQNFPGGSASGSFTNAVFNISTSCGGASNCLQWVDDDSTDNCGTATTAFMALINGYAGPGNVQVVIGGSGAGKAYKLSTCGLAFTNQLGANIHIWATIDCASSTASCIQVGTSGLSSTVATEKYNIDGAGGTLYGGASLTLAGIYVEPYVNNIQIQGLNFGGPQGSTHNGGFGANNATLGSCTNYLIYIDSPINEGYVGHTFGGVTSTSSTSGGCGYSNSGGGTIGTNTVFFEHNTIASSGNVSPSSSCGSQGLIAGGSYDTTLDNNLYGFGVDLRLMGVGHRVIGNNLDSANCTAHAVNAAIQIGAPASSVVVSAVSIEGNSAQVIAGHTGALIAQAGDSTASIQGADVSGNQNITGGSAAVAGALFSGTLNCTAITNTAQCSIVGNQGFFLSTPGTGWATPNAPGEAFAACNPLNCAAQTANVGAITVFTAPSIVSGAIMVGCHLIVTVQATTSGTIPSCVIAWTDASTSGASTITLPPINTGGADPAVADYPTQMVLIQPKVSTTVTLATTGYVSVGATSLTYIPALRGVVQ